jgi:hypothetical protein
MSRFDFGDSLYKEANSSNRQRLSYAEIEVKKGLEAGPFQLLKNAKTETELEQRKALIQGRVDELVTLASNKYEVDAQALQAYASTKVAEVAVTKPKSVKPDSPIGGSSEDSKYADTDKTPDVDGKTTVDDEKAVVEEPKRHKLETVDLNKDKQKDASVKESASSLDLLDLMEICKEYNQMGWAVVEQLETYLETGSLEGLNPNAVEYFQDFLRKVVQVAQGTLAGEEALTELNQLETLPVDEDEIY